MKYLLLLLFPISLFCQTGIQEVYTFNGDEKIHYYPDNETETFKFNTSFKLTDETFEIETPYNNYKLHIYERYKYYTDKGLVINVITETSSYEIYIIKKVISVIVERPFVGVRKIEYVKKSVKI